MLRIINSIEEMPEDLLTAFKAMIYEAAKRDLIEGDELADMFEASYAVRFSPAMKEMTYSLMLETRMGML